MPTYAYVTFSGSAGKTTSGVTLAVSLAQTARSIKQLKRAAKKRRVRMIDTDAQGNATAMLGYPDYKGRGSAEVIKGEASIKDVELPARVDTGRKDDDGNPIYQEIPGLTIVPACTASLDKLLVELPAITGGVTLLRDALAEAKQADAKEAEAKRAETEDADTDDVDLKEVTTLIDCGGHLTPIVMAAVLATTHEEDDERPNSWGLIACTKPAEKEWEGLVRIENELPKINRAFKTNIRVLSVIPCMVPPTNDFYADEVERLEDKFGDLLTPEVRRNPAPDKSYKVKKPLPLYGYNARDIMEDYDMVLEHQQEQGLYPEPQPIGIAA